MKRSFGVLVRTGMLFLLASCSYLSEKPKVEQIDAQTWQTTSVAQATAIQTELYTPDGDEEFVRVVDYIPDIHIDLKYASTDNFTGQRIYGFSDAYLRYGTVKKLMLVQQELRLQGLTLKIWDGFRPPSAQFALWEICPDPTYVSDPNKGFSSHSRGNTVDITLVDEKGKELVMPSGFDDFSERADRDYTDCSEEAAANVKFLEELMEKHGFKGYYGEWWHYTDRDDYEVEMDFLSE